MDVMGAAEKVQREKIRLGEKKAQSKEGDGEGTKQTERVSGWHWVPPERL